MVTRTRLDVTFIRTLGALLNTDTIKFISGYRLTSKGAETVTVRGGLINISAKFWFEFVFVKSGITHTATSK